MKFDLQLFGRLFVWSWAIGIILWSGLWMWRFANQYGGWTRWDYLYLLRTASEEVLTSIGAVGLSAAVLAAVITTWRGWPRRGDNRE